MVRQGMASATVTVVVVQFVLSAFFWIWPSQNCACVEGKYITPCETPRRSH